MQKKRTKNKILIAIGVVILALLLFAFGTIAGVIVNNEISSSYENRSYNEAMTEPNAVSKGFSTDLEDTDAANDATQNEGAETTKLFASTESEDQKLIYSGEATIGTEDVQKTYKDLTKKMSKYGAKFESVNETQYTKDVCIRVEKEKFMSLYNDLSDISGNITSSNIDIKDATRTFTDNERKIDALKTEYDEMKELMKKAKNVDEVLSIKDRMTEISYELQSLQQSNKDIDYDSKYSRLNLHIRKIGIHPAETISFWSQIKESFDTSISIIKGIVLFLVTIWWFILLVVVGIICGRHIMKKENHKKEKGKEAEIYE